MLAAAGIISEYRNPFILLSWSRTHPMFSSAHLSSLIHLHPPLSLLVCAYKRSIHQAQLPYPNPTRSRSMDIIHLVFVSFEGHTHHIMDFVFNFFPVILWQELKIWLPSSSQLNLTLGTPEGGVELCQVLQAFCSYVQPEEFLQSQLSLDAWRTQVTEEKSGIGLSSEKYERIRRGVLYIHFFFTSVCFEESEALITVSSGLKILNHICVNWHKQVPLQNTNCHNEPKVHSMYLLFKRSTDPNSTSVEFYQAHPATCNCVQVAMTIDKTMYNNYFKRIVLLDCLHLHPNQVLYHQQCADLLLSLLNRDWGVL